MCTAAFLGFWQFEKWTDDWTPIARRFCDTRDGRPMSTPLEVKNPWHEGCYVYHFTRWAFSFAEYIACFLIALGNIGNRIWHLISWLSEIVLFQQNGSKSRSEYDWIQWFLLNPYISVWKWSLESLTHHSWNRLKKWRCLEIGPPKSSQIIHFFQMFHEIYTIQRAWEVPPYGNGPRIWDTAGQERPELKQSTNNRWSEWDLMGIHES